MKLRLALACLAALGLAAARAQDAPVALNAGMHLIRAEVARTPAQRAAGLMQRERLGANEGMLFVFDAPGVQCFWMKNTPLPLSIAFLADDGKVVNLADMQPHSTTQHCSSAAVRYALEMHQGWFAKRGVQPGSRIAGAPFTR